MKQCSIVLFVIIGCFLGCRQNDNELRDEIINLPVTFLEGFGPFTSDYGGISAEYTLDNPNGAVWVKTYKPVKGIPKQWKKVAKSMVWLNGHQLVYQNFHEGNIDTSFYLSLQKAWNWTPDEKRLSRKPIRCYVYVVSGLDTSGKLAMMIDTNNNRDFSDEKPFYPETATLSDTLRYYKNSYQIEYDIFREGRVMKTHIPMVIKYRPDDPGPTKLFCSFPRYATATVIIGNQPKTLAINLGFTSPSGYEVSELALIDKNTGDEKIALGRGIRMGEFVNLEIDGHNKRYKNLGFDEFSGVLRLAGAPLKNNEYATQQGFKFKPFSGLEFSNGKPLALQHYRGKYLYVEFWGTWCKPCIEELPALTRVYEKVDTNQVNFIGIVGSDTPERLAKFLKNNPIRWPQILSSDTNKLVEAYKVDMYPSSFLIGPDGVIVDKNLRGAKLETKLRELGCIK